MTDDPTGRAMPQSQPYDQTQAVPQSYDQTQPYIPTQAGAQPYGQPQAFGQPPTFGQPYGQPQAFGRPYQPVPQRIPRPSPFAGVPRVDFALDAVAATTLLAALLLPWTAANRGYSRPEVVIGVVLALGGVFMSYLSRMGLFGATWTPAKLRVTKLVAGTPLVLCTVAYFVIDAVLGALGAGATQFAPAPGAWIATAGAVLAAVPRRSDLFDAGAERSANLWGTVLTGTQVVLAVCTALALVGVLLGTYRSLPEVLELRAMILLPLVQTLLMGVWVIAVYRVIRSAARGDASAHLVLAATGAGAFTWAILAALGHFTLGYAESLHLPFGGFTLTMVAALVATSPALARKHGEPDASGWLAATRGVFGLVVVANLLLLAQTVVSVAMTGALTAGVFTTTACAGAGAVAADWARQQVSSNPARSRTPVLIAAAVQAALGVALILVIGLSMNSWEAITGPQVIAAFALPASAAAFVTLPKPMRDFFPRSTMAPQPVMAPQYFPPQQSLPPQPFLPQQSFPPHQSVPPQPVPQPQSLPPQQQGPARAAADPATPAPVLYSLAQQDTSLWPYIAANPSTPQDLLAWLAQSQDPVVIAALRARQP